MQCERLVLTLAFPFPVYLSQIWIILKTRCLMLPAPLHCNSTPRCKGVAVWGFSAARLLHCRLLGGSGGRNAVPAQSKNKAVNANVNSIILKSLPKSGKLFRIIEFTFAFTGLSFDCTGAAFAPNGLCSPAAPQRNRFAAPQHDRAAPQKPSQQPWLRPCSKGEPWCGPSLAACRFASIAGPPLAKREAGC